MVYLECSFCHKRFLVSGWFQSSQLLSVPLQICANTNNEIVENIEGEICIRGYNVANGYLGNTEKNYAFRNGWFHSGDYGKKDNEGNIYFEGSPEKAVLDENIKKFYLGSEFKI